MHVSRHLNHETLRISLFFALSSTAGYLLSGLRRSSHPACIFSGIFPDPFYLLPARGLRVHVTLVEKQMYDSVIKGKENASKHWNCIDNSDESQYLRSVWLAFLPAYFICICLCYVAFQNFLRLGLLFFSENKLRQPCSAEVDKNEVSKAAMWMQLVFFAEEFKQGCQISHFNFVKFGHFLVCHCETRFLLQQRFCLFVFFIGTSLHFYTVAV